MIGTIDHTYRCADEKCGAECHDILDEEGFEWRIECCFCGAGQRVRAIRGHLKPKGDGFVFIDGRFEGKTVDEAAAEPRGLDYVKWAAEHHKRQAVRNACKTFLDNRKTPS